MPSWIFSVETGLAGLSDDERTKVPAQQWLHHTAGVLTSVFALSVGQSPFWVGSSRYGVLTLTALRAGAGCVWAGRRRAQPMPLALRHLFSSGGLLGPCSECVPALAGLLAALQGAASTGVELLCGDREGRGQPVALR